VPPATWLSVLFFFIFIAPGLLFELLSERRRGGISESAFREISRVVLASILFSGLAFAILAVVRTVRATWMPDPSRLISSPSVYGAKHYGLVLWALLAEVLLALAAVVVTHSALAYKQGAPVRRVSTWRHVFKESRPPGADVFVRVRLSNGMVYVGEVAAFTVDPSDDAGELVIAPPIFSKTGDNKLTPVPGIYQRVVIPRSAIEVLSVEYRQRHAASPSPSIPVAAPGPWSSPP
jgi:Family of unknown function (DUF6338)